MKEYLSNLNPEVYDEIYHVWVAVPKTPLLVGQHALDGDILLYDNPESKFNAYTVIPQDIEVTVVDERQGRLWE